VLKGELQTESHSLAQSKTQKVRRNEIYFQENNMASKDFEPNL
jgi:hypothetical protein